MSSVPGDSRSRPLHCLQRLNQLRTHDPLVIAVDLSVADAIRQGEPPSVLARGVCRREFQFARDPASVVAVRDICRSRRGEIQEFSEAVGRDGVRRRSTMRLQHRELHGCHALANGEDGGAVLIGRGDGSGVAEIVHGNLLLSEGKGEWRWGYSTRMDREGEIGDAGPRLAATWLTSC